MLFHVNYIFPEKGLLDIVVSYMVYVLTVRVAN